MSGEWSITVGRQAFHNVSLAICIFIDQTNAFDSMPLQIAGAQY